MYFTGVIFLFIYFFWAKDKKQNACFAEEE